mgnify:CR=1 FL=1
MLNSIGLRANIAVMKVLVKLLIQDYLHIPCTHKILMKNTGWWLLQGCLGQFLNIYLITHVLHGRWRYCEPKGACLFSACIICAYSCCFSGVNVLANWHVPLNERDYTRPLHIYLLSPSQRGLYHLRIEKYIYFCRHFTDVIVDW